MRRLRRIGMTMGFVCLLISLAGNAGAFAERESETQRKPPVVIGDQAQTQTSAPETAEQSAWQSSPGVSSRVQNVRAFVQNAFSAAVSWTDEAQGETYSVTWYTVAGDERLCFAGSRDVTGNTFEISPLAPGADYYVRVESVRGGTGADAVFSTPSANNKYAEGRYSFRGGKIYWVNWNQRERSFDWESYWREHANIYRVRADRWHPKDSGRKYILEITYSNGSEAIERSEILTVMRTPSGGVLYMDGKIEAAGWTYEKRVLPCDLTDLLYGYFDTIGGGLSETGLFTFDVYIDRQYAGGAEITVVKAP